MKQLKNWFLQEARDLPWRQNRTPYAVWISEVMLQQTQVAVVIPYFNRWMERFPTVEALAQAPIEEVIKCWEGLGYYSRARNLHAGAKQIVQKFGGVIPDTRQALLSIKGLGPYTVGAILSFAFHKKCAAVDGNVMRVMARLYHIEEEIDKPSTQKKIWDLAESFLPDVAPWVINEALIELGAKVCQKKPLCQKCPLQKSCLAYRHQSQEQLPKKGKKISISKLDRQVFVMQTEKKTLLRKGKKGQIMQDLYEFPYTSIESKHPLQKILQFSLIEELPKVQHTFTRYLVTLFPSRYFCKKEEQVEDHVWVETDALQELPFSSGHRRVLSDLFNS